MDEEILRQIEQIIGYKFSDKNLLVKAFTHSSAVDDRLLSNERLEFLGDAVVNFVAADYLEPRDLEEPSHFNALFRLEVEAGVRTPFTDIARYLHLWGRRTG